ncbi:hypothetical protein [Telmatospirillum siberiense]|uniref:Tetratricopeptide repeat protein n=1 Tax=Telmatospirillum siberiense TaxID=382514 RepID=A0A2N3PVZ1_9PROT|nr:hypothetical protein [Telmatospirillum siberiense]PKU24560.1 hypothetical protein CWS72_10700 [Telmatospirillum siberiense]
MAAMADDQVTDDGLAAAAALLGADLPEVAERQLRLAGLAYQRDAEALDHLARAEALAPDHLAVLIGFYRFYFYKGRLAEALTVAERCLARVAGELRIAADWRAVVPGQADFGDYDAMLPRFYLFTLKAYAYLQLRLGAFTEGALAVTKLLALDPTDKVGAKVLLEVLAHREDADDD